MRRIKRQPGRRISVMPIRWMMMKHHSKIENRRPEHPADRIS